ncbi:hypothetical protein [Aliiruegeria sabulilitoris]|uniref:hypothetical protein n=1 Tax=Aliiruegeria sabulilitoris TaxID=1510458 RepID=UPI0018D1FE95|nr:hypothetical protein [Aliiruegeria sabulilitoris]
MSAYRYALLSPGAPVQPNTFGVELTDPTMAAACVANLDPQHGGPAGAPAAVEAACRVVLPRPGTTLATLRPDADALGAMAVMAWRAAGLPVREAMATRIGRVGRMDRFERGPWPGPARADAPPDSWPGAELSAMSSCCFDDSLPMAERVARMSRWLALGELSEAHATAGAHAQAALARSVTEGSTFARLSAPAVALVHSEQRGALELGFRIAPIVVATHPFFCFPAGKCGPKHTVAVWEGEGLELFREVVVQHEPGWGGSAGIVGSPQSHPSILDPDTVLEVLIRCLPKRVPT